MEISDIRVKLIHQSKERLRAVCSVTFDDAFVVRDVKVVDGTSGTFVAMPSRKLSGHCPKCRHKNQIRARFCNECGGKLPPPRPPEDSNGRSRYHRDIAHPINTEFREMIQAKVLEAFAKELAENPEVSEGERERESERDDRSERPEPKPQRRSDEPVVADRMKEPTFDEPEEKFGEVESVEEKSEFDSLIAGLKPGGPPRPRNTGRGERPAPGGDRDRGSSEKSDRDRGRSSRGGRGGRSENRQERPAEKIEKKETPPPARPAAKPVERAAETKAVAVTDESDDTQFGAEILTETKAPAKVIPARTPDPVPEVVEPVKVDEDDDGGFGAGLL